MKKKSVLFIRFDTPLTLLSDRRGFSEEREREREDLVKLILNREIFQGYFPTKRRDMKISRYRFFLRINALQTLFIYFCFCI